MSQVYSSLNPSEILRQKRDGQELSAEQWKQFIQDYTSSKIADYQMSALLMAGFINGLSSKETAALTDAMLYSGDVLDFGDTPTIDKHSTGGVGDKTSFILAPLASACGVHVPMMAGRGLGHTGGTIDKIESIKGFKVDLPLDEFKKQVIEEKLCLIGQTSQIAPADKKIYALRDVTATVESIPFITASIMSKKLAEGASGIVMDVKTGNGAFMAKKSDAKALAKSLIKTAKRFDKKMLAFITDMSQPLGTHIGNSLEMIESIETLKNKGPKDLTQLSLKLAGAMIFLAGKAKTKESGTKKAKKVLESGAALEEFRKLIKLQGGDVAVIDDYSKFPLATHKTIVKASKTGQVHSFKTRAIGLHCVELGGGRKISSDSIDHAVGLVVHKKIGDKVKEGENLVTIYHHKKQQSLAEQIAKSLTENDILIKKSVSKIPELVWEVLS
jgi:pyrimidine-nucleoside phosphorylase